MLWPTNLGATVVCIAIKMSIHLMSIIWGCTSKGLSPVTVFPDWNQISAPDEREHFCFGQTTHFTDTIFSLDTYHAYSSIVLRVRFHPRTLTVSPWGNRYVPSADGTSHQLPSNSRSNSFWPTITMKITTQGNPVYHHPRVNRMILLSTVPSFTPPLRSYLSFLFPSHLEGSHPSVWSTRYSTPHAVSSHQREHASLDVQCTTFIPIIVNMVIG
jgi:hypothetical protein